MSNPQMKGKYMANERCSKRLILEFLLGNIGLLIGLLGVLAAQSVSAAEEPWAANPWRVVEGKRCHLQPLYDFLNRGGDRSALEKNPMPAWSVFERAVVVQVTAEGLLLDRGVWFTERGGRMVMIKNFPVDGLVDGQRVSFVARPAGTWSGLDTSGARRTLPAFDYGIPVAAPKARR